MNCEASYVHWMDIGIEEQWQREFATPLPRLTTSYDTKVFDTERLSVFWGRPQDVVLLRREPPPEWVEHLRISGIGVPTILALDCELQQFGSGHLSVLLPYLAKKFPQPKLLPYVATEAGWELRALAGGVLEGCSPLFTREMSNKAVQRNLLAAAGIPTPDFKVFESYGELADFLSDANCDRGYVLKCPYGASGQGMFVLDGPDKVQYLQRRLRQKRESVGKTVLILEKWHQVKSHVSYQLTLQRDGTASFEFLRQQILSGSVFRGLHFPADLDSGDQVRLESLGLRVGRLLAARGANGIINVDAIVTLDGRIFPAIDINLRFSLATYFSRYIVHSEPNRHIKIHYYDLPDVENIQCLLRTTESLANAEGTRAVVASISERCARGLRRVFLLIDGSCHQSAERFEQLWLDAMGSKGES